MMDATLSESTQRLALLRAPRTQHNTAWTLARFPISCDRLGEELARSILKKMKLIAPSIKVTIVLAFGACVALTVAVAVFGKGLTNVNLAARTTYSQVTAAIVDLSEIRISQLDSRLQLRRNLYFRNLDKTKISNEIAIATSWIP